MSMSPKDRRANENIWIGVFFVLSVLLIVLRLFFWPGHPLSFWGTMETIAHIYVGLSFGAIVFYRPNQWVPNTEPDQEGVVYGKWGPNNHFRKLVFWICMASSLVELVMAVLYLTGVYVR